VLQCCWEVLSSRIVQRGSSSKAASSSLGRALFSVVVYVLSRFLHAPHITPPLPSLRDQRRVNVDADDPRGAIELRWPS
jgi:hypothetical protein